MLREVKSKSGFGFLELMITITVLTLILIPIASYFQSKIGAQRRTESTQNYLDIDEYFQSSIAITLEDFINELGDAAAPSCAQAGAAFTNGVAGVGPILPFQSTPGDFQLVSADGDWGYTGDANHEDAKARCNAQTNLAPGSSLVGRTGMYFCVQVVQNGPNAPQILRQSPVFAEISFTFRNYEDSSPVNCEDYHDDPPAGGTNLRGGFLVYSLYWQNRLKQNSDGTEEIEFHVHRNAVRVFHE